MIPLIRKNTSAVFKRKVEEIKEKVAKGESSLSKEAVTAILEGKSLMLAFGLA